MRRKLLKRRMMDRTEIEGPVCRGETLLLFSGRVKGNVISLLSSLVILHEKQ
jgi:hypothetical protein